MIKPKQYKGYSVETNNLLIGYYVELRKCGGKDCKLYPYIIKPGMYVLNMTYWGLRDYQINPDTLEEYVGDIINEN